LIIFNLNLNLNLALITESSRSSTLEATLIIITSDQTLSWAGESSLQQSAARYSVQGFDTLTKLTQVIGTDCLLYSSF